MILDQLTVKQVFPFCHILKKQLCNQTNEAPVKQKHFLIFVKRVGNPNLQ